MPFFDETGRPCREKLDAAMMAVRLVSEIPGTLDALNEIVKHAPRIAAARG
jgi:hypothetical protein